MPRKIYDLAQAIKFLEVETRVSDRWARINQGEWTDMAQKEAANDSSRPHRRASEAL